MRTASGRTIHPTDRGSDRRLDAGTCPACPGRRWSRRRGPGRKGTQRGLRTRRLAQGRSHQPRIGSSWSPNEHSRCRRHCRRKPRRRRRRTKRPPRRPRAGAAERRPAGTPRPRTRRRQRRSARRQSHYHYTPHRGRAVDHCRQRSAADRRTAARTRRPRGRTCRPRCFRPGRAWRAQEPADLHMWSSGLHRGWPHSRSRSHHRRCSSRHHRPGGTGPRFLSNRPW